jgi:hypothetical protein
MEIYKSVRGCIITLELDLTTPHNLDRSGVIDVRFAKFRCQQALVKSIVDKHDENKKYDSIRSEFDYDFIYKVGEIISEPKFVITNKDTVSGNGIHFFTTKIAAWNHQLIIIPENYTGDWYRFYSNGLLHTQIRYVNGEKHGPAVLCVFDEGLGLVLEKIIKYFNRDIYEKCCVWKYDTNLYQEYDLKWKKIKEEIIY